jgi:hypothetical protein
MLYKIIHKLIIKMLTGSIPKNDVSDTNRIT